INETSDRSPLTDWYETKNANKVGFTARPVVGGVFLKMLYDKQVWGKWASRDTTHASNWAPLPKAPIVTEVIKTALSEPAFWSYSTSAVPSDWFAADFDAGTWSTGKSGFGSEDTPNSVIGTVWTSSDIWMVRDIELSSLDHFADLHWLVHHDEDTEIFINGKLAAKFSGYSVQYALHPLSQTARSLLKSGKNRISVHCHQTAGGQYIDVGLATVTRQE
ncbi:MAG: glutaminase domain-containing protein, partial [Pirellula sp.]